MPKRCSRRTGGTRSRSIASPSREPEAVEPEPEARAGDSRPKRRRRRRGAEPPSADNGRPPEAEPPSPRPSARPPAAPAAALSAPLSREAALDRAHRLRCPMREGDPGLRDRGFVGALLDSSLPAHAP